MQTDYKDDNLDKQFLFGVWVFITDRSSDQCTAGIVDSDFVCSNWLVSYQIYTSLYIKALFIFKVLIRAIIEMIRWIKPICQIFLLFQILKMDCYLIHCIGGTVVKNMW